MIIEHVSSLRKPFVHKIDSLYVVDFLMYHSVSWARLRVFSLPDFVFLNISLASYLHIQPSTQWRQVRPSLQLAHLTTTLCICFHQSIKTFSHPGQQSSLQIATTTKHAKATGAGELGQFSPTEAKARGDPLSVTEEEQKNKKHDSTCGILVVG